MESMLLERISPKQSRKSRNARELICVRENGLFIVTSSGVHFHALPFLTVFPRQITITENTLFFLISTNMQLI